ncbi:hypothetical protein IW261DRAFT_1304351, partial [Armillaria novae-zelandiae]
LLRKNLMGIKIPDLNNNVTCKLFADDTLAYLGPEDKLSTLDKVTCTFCTATTAVFNNKKTEFLPVGSEDYRNNVIRNGNLPDEPEYKMDESQIVPDGQAVRSLGCYIGNHIEEYEKWNEIAKKCESITTAWKQLHPPFSSRVMLTQSLLIQRTQYLATVNALPPKIEKTITKTIYDFIWDDKKGYINREGTLAPIKSGGLNVPSLKARYDTILINWIQRWL